MIYGIKGATEIAADLVIEAGSNTFVCNIDPSKRDRTPNALPIEQQPIWQITKYESVKENGKNITRAKYPDGLNSYNFAPSNVDNYNYTYRL